MEQFIYKTLQTERYHYEIYNWSYGIESEDLFGKPLGYVKAELLRRIKEALMTDNRITEVDSFIFLNPSEGSDKRTAICVNFTVHTIFGSITASKDVIL